MHSPSRLRCNPSTIIKTTLVGVLTLTSFLTASIAHAASYEWYMSKRDFSKKQGTTASSGITIDRYDGWRGPVTFSYVGLPTGVTGTVSTNPMTTNRGTASLFIGTTAPTGYYNFILRASAEGVIKDQRIELSISRGTTTTGTSTGGSGTAGTSTTGGTSTGGSSTAGTSTTGGTSTGGSSTAGTSTTGGTSTGGSSTAGTPTVSTYTISVPPTASAQQGQSTTVPITINRTNFTNPVNLTLAGAPLGVSATFNPASTTSNSIMTLNVSAGVSPSTYNMTVAATSGSLLQTLPISLTVTAQPANFTMSTPSSLSVQRGQSNSLELTLSRTNMTSSIAFTLSGLPSGVSGACPATTISSSTCSFTASSTATTGPSTITIQAVGGGITRTSNVSMNITAAPTSSGLKAFPEAEGFGAISTTGGRGGVVCKVTNLNRSGAGSLQACMDINGPAYILFNVSGIIDGSLECHIGNKTIAGQTSPAGIITRGMIFDDVYEANPLCSNVILRHLRSRPAASERSANGGYVNDDSIRLDGAKNMVLDHISLERAGDEAFQLSRSNNITIQNSILAETPPAHYWGGMLINYSTTAHNLDNLSIHHNLWTGIQARFPEISCEENGDDRLGTSNCTNKHLKIELSNNMIYDPSDPIWYNRCTGTNAGNDCAASGPSFFLDMNWVGNYMKDRTGSDNAVINGDLLADSRNRVYYSDNFFDAGLASLVDFNTLSISSPFLYPEISYTPGSEIPEYMNNHAGAFPRDPMDQRLVGYIDQNINNTPTATNTSARTNDTFRLLTTTCSIPEDTDNDGMPDVWERNHGLSVGIDDHNGTNLSNYPNIEVYLNELSNQVVTRGSATTALCDIASW